MNAKTEYKEVNAFIYLYREKTFGELHDSEVNKAIVASSATYPLLILCLSSA